MLLLCGWPYMMLLPSELRSLVFLAGLTAVCAQAVSISTAPTYTASAVEATTTNAPLPAPSADTNDLTPPSVDPNSEAPPEPQPTEGIYPCYLADPPDWCEEEPPPFWHPEVSATGWDEWDQWNNDNVGGGGGQGFAPSTTVLRPTEQPPVVITTRTPTVIEIRTSVEPSGTDAVGESGATRVPAPAPAPTADGHTEQQGSPAQPTAETGAPQNVGSGASTGAQGNPSQPTPGQPAPEEVAHDAKPSESRPQTASSENNLLDTIIGQLGKAKPVAQPAPALAPTTDASGTPISREPQDVSPTGTARVEEESPTGAGEATPDTASPGATGIASAQESIAVGNTITLGSATLTLTPGLFTIIGTGSDTTLVAIQTDTASQTIITVSSSGTAITATITNAPATMTLPRTGFEASITDSAGRGVATPRPDSTAATTSSRGMASDRKAGVGGITGLVLGFLVFVLAS